MISKRKNTHIKNQKLDILKIFDQGKDLSSFPIYHLYNNFLSLDIEDTLE